MTTITLSILKDLFSVYKKDPTSPLPEWLDDCEFYHISKTDEELSIVCPQDFLPANTQAEKDWACIKVEGPLEFSLTGILANILKPLAQQNISVFTISTFNTDYIMVKENTLKASIQTLKEAGYRFTEPGHKPF